MEHALKTLNCFVMDNTFIKSLRSRLMSKTYAYVVLNFMPLVYRTAQLRPFRYKKTLKTVLTFFILSPQTFSVDYRAVKQGKSLPKCCRFHHRYTGLISRTLGRPFFFRSSVCSSFQFSVKRGRLSIHLQAFKRTI